MFNTTETKKGKVNPRFLKSGKKLYTTIVIALLSINGFAQAPNWAWAKSTGANGYDDTKSVATDSWGNVYLAGWFSCPTITFGSTTLINASSGYTDAYLVKYDNNGNALWAKRIGGIDAEKATCVAVDTSGNVYMAGTFGSAGISIGSFSLANALYGTIDFFIAKYDTNGNVLWAVRNGAAGDDVPYSIATDVLGNFYLVGSYKSTSLSFFTTTIFNNGDDDIFIAKYNTNGIAIWAKSGGGITTDIAYSVVTDTAGNVYVTGYFTSSTLNLSVAILANAGSGFSADIFVVKYNSSGTAQWAIRAGGSGWEQANSIATDASGNVYVTGYFGPPSISFGATTLTNTGARDTYLVKYNTNGNAIWAKNAIGIDYDEANSVATDAFGNVYITGVFDSPTATFGATILTNTGGTTTYDMFLVKYDSIGNVIWAKSSGGTSDETANSVATDIQGNVFVTGCFISPNINFDATSFINSGPVGYPDIYVAKIDSTQFTVGIPQSEIRNLQSTITISPNPFTTFTTITFAEEQKNASIKVYDIVGMEVANSQLATGNSITIDLTAVSNGIYFAEIKTDKGTVNRKIVKQ